MDEDDSMFVHGARSGSDSILMINALTDSILAIWATSLIRNDVKTGRFREWWEFTKSQIDAITSSF